MSIKNIIQQENDLQEMSQQSLANYLNNPTGQYNPYLVAGELQRKEQFAQRQMVEAPQETVVDELVQKTMPMGGMPMGGMPMPQMPMPGPQETMVSDTITETGIASLPAPNIGQNYAKGGIIGYEEGGEVGFFDQIRDFDYKGFLNERLESAGRDLDERSARNKENFRIYEETGSFPEMTDEDLDDAMAFLPGAGLKSVGKKGVEKATPYFKKGLDYLKDKFKSTPKKKLTKKQKPPTKKQEAAKVKTDKVAQKKKDALTGTPGAVDRALISGGRGAFEGIGRGLGALSKGLQANPVASTIGFGLTGLGAGMMYNAAEESKIQEEAGRLELEAKALEREATKREQLNQIQASLDAKQAARDKRREKEMYLALALGGAKTMAGKSQFALQNIGEGLGAGVGAIAAYDQNEMERMTASQNATIKARQDMQIAMADYENNYREAIRDLDDNEMYNARLQELEDYGYTEADLALAKASLLEEFVGLPTNSYFANINGQQFTAVE